MAIQERRGDSTRPSSFLRVGSTCMLLLAMLSRPLAAQVTQRVSLGGTNLEGDSVSEYGSISADGRYVAFDSDASNLVVGDTNAKTDVFVRDRELGTTERVSLDSSGAQANGHCYRPSISADGRYVAFVTDASNLVAGDMNGKIDLFVHDRLLSTTERVSVSSGGVEGNGHSTSGSISADGRYVAFSSGASNLVGGDSNGTYDIFVRDRQLGVTELVSLDSTGVQGNGFSDEPSISADGRYVAFLSSASNLVGGDTNGTYDIFVHDRLLGLTERVSVSSGGAEGNGSSLHPSISADGRCIAFQSNASGLVSGDTNGVADAFVRDRQLGATERVSFDLTGAEWGYDSGTPSISADGRCVAFKVTPPFPFPGEGLFLRDRMLGATERVSVSSNGAEANQTVGYATSLSADGRYAAFWSYATNLVPGDTNGVYDVFVRDRFGGPSFTSLCDPGVAGVIGCPCGNPPGGANRGCDNSAATGGASLSAAGGTYVSSDSLVFTTSGEKPTATTVLLQGTSSPAAGVVYGQGVRCVGGTLKRLFTKTASGGSITAPNFGAGDPTVSARSAAKGNPISAGQSRFYLVFYRDPIVLGGCPAPSTFNATQTGVVTWSP